MKLLPDSWGLDFDCTAFVVEGTSGRDIQMLFDEEDLDDNPPVVVPVDTKMEDLVVRLKKFPSKTQARKNGWSGEIPVGWNVWVIGRFQFITYKPLPPEEDEDQEEGEIQ